ncbi:Alpha-1,6-mannosylglycoprotein 6-beta-N-acetylglucosaminyltransferase B-like [Oopsacas minuta]|uniref:alpha-1,6-mannosyl-glycoprotein 6-beta-N-acetylglucosaminyltransferase n=1 Tax=Oopsacas minuta TaxID=111878 RepID=A0AAV7KHT9_9METZ|nr:Alpha-1,6-mannosylglycoprotein 6-beta-N-acetylglucosaminyltransferase B-like [Oopsacas minuta]
MYIKIYRLQVRYCSGFRSTSKLLFLSCVCIWSLVCCHLYLSTCYYCNQERDQDETNWPLVIEHKGRWSPDRIYQSNKIPDLGIFLNSDMFLSQGKRLLWIKQRISRLSEDWERAFEDVKHKPYIQIDPMSVLVFPGLLSEYSPYNFAENAFKGGYLGELIQWSDLLAGLHILGHRVRIITQREYVLSLKNTTDEFDLVFTDYTGLKALESIEMFLQYKCKTRVLDVYGTEPRYNFRTADYNTLERYANWNLEDTKQFWTFYPDTPDNTFLGFVVPQSNTIPTRTVTNRNIAVVYGKLADSLYNQRHNVPLLQMVSEFFEVHSTFREGYTHLPDNIINHGFLKSNDFAMLLGRAKLFIGLGYPYDGPGPFEALAEGAIFLQHKFSPSRNRDNDKFFSVSEEYSH